MPALVPQLAQIRLLSGLSRPILDDLVSRGSTRRCPPGRDLVTEGAADAGMQLVLEGSAVVVVAGKEVRSLEQGDYFGEMSLIDGGSRSATVRAGEQGCTTFAISPLSFWELVGVHPEMARALLVVLAARIRDLEARNPSSAVD